MPGMVGFVNKTLHENRVSSKMGTASYKASRFLKRLLSR